MIRTAFSQAQRIYGFCEAMVASLAQANMPYAAQTLLVLRLTGLLAVGFLARLSARSSQSIVH